MYGILSLIKSMYGRPAMKRVMEVMKRHPDHRLTQAVQNKGAPTWWYEGSKPGNRGGYSKASQLGAAEQILNRSSSFLNPHPYSSVMLLAKFGTLFLFPICCQFCLVVLVWTSTAHRLREQYNFFLKHQIFINFFNKIIV